MSTVSAAAVLLRGLGAAQLHNYRRSACVITAAAQPQHLHTIALRNSLEMRLRIAEATLGGALSHIRLEKSSSELFGSVNESIRPISEEQERMREELKTFSTSDWFTLYSHSAHLCRRGLPGFHRNPPFWLFPSRVSPTAGVYGFPGWISKL